MPKRKRSEVTTSTPPPSPEKDEEYDDSLSTIGVEGATPRTFKRVKRIFTEEYQQSARVISSTLGNAEVLERKPTGTPIKIGTTTPRKRELELVSTKIYSDKKAITFFIPRNETSDYNSDEEAQKLKANPEVSTQDVVVTAVATLKTIRERTKMSRISQNAVMGGSANDIFEEQLLDLVSKELADASKVHAHLVAKAIGGDDEEPNRVENLSVVTSRTNINMFIPERFITSGLRNGSFDEINLKVTAKEVCIDDLSTKVAVKIDYNINGGLTMSFNGFSITKLPSPLRKFMRAFIDDYMSNSDSAVAEKSGSESPTATSVP